MSIPGFAAEASLFSVSAGYRAATEAALHESGLVHPAASDVFYPYPTWCLKWRCIPYPPNFFPKCSQVLGFWNHVTHTCE